MVLIYEFLYVLYVYMRSIFKYKYKNCSECKELLYYGLTNPIRIRCNPKI